MSAFTQTIAKIPLILRVVSLYVVVALAIGTSVILTTPESKAETPLVANVEKPQSSTLTKIISGRPVHFSIERLGMELPVRDGVYNSDTKEWTLSDDAVYFATITSKPNDTRGNTFLYGHNQSQVLGPMKDIQVGDVLTIQTSNGHTFRYSYVRDSVVAPTFTSVLKENPDTPQLTVMTCEGIWSDTRRLMYFDLLEVK